MMNSKCIPCMERYKLPAGVTVNVAVQLALARRSSDPPPKTFPQPDLTRGIDRRPDYPKHYGWNPVYWSDYPKQPMWTVPMPKITAPTVSRALPELPELPCHCPPSEHMTFESCPTWIPDIHRWSSKFNPYVSETNTPFIYLLGPPTLPQAALVETLYCP